MKIKIEDDHGNEIKITPEEFAAFILTLQRSRTATDCLQPLCLYGRVPGPDGSEYCTCATGKALRLSETGGAG